MTDNKFNRYAEQVKEAAAELGDKASDAYHYNVPERKRPLFWVAAICLVTIVLWAIF